MLDTLYADDAFLKAEDAWNIDTKLDDGKPATGKVQSDYFLTTACTNAASATDYNTTYKLSDPAARCSLLFSYGS